MNSPLFIKLSLSGKVLVYPEDNGTNQCFLLDKNSSSLQNVEKTLANKIMTQLNQFDEMMHLKKIVNDSVYLFINSNQLEDKIEVKVSYPLKGLSFKIKKTDETLSDYLVDNYLAQDVVINYYHCSSEPYLEKYLLENKMSQINVNKKTLKV